MGTMPNTPYFARMAASWATSGMAGYRMNGISTMFMRTVRSSPVTVMVDWPGSFDGAMS